MKHVLFFLGACRLSMPSTGVSALVGQTMDLTDAQMGALVRHSSQ